MGKTKENILLQAMTLFNEQGISAVSLRAIANKAGISVGNLQYHFKKREDVIEALYFQLVEKINATVELNPENLLQSFFDLSANMFSVLYDYRFFLLDFTTITRNNNKIKSHYAEISNYRAQQFHQLADVLIQNGLLRKESLRGEFKHLYKRTEIISNFWFSSQLIQAPNIVPEPLGNMRSK